MDDERGCFLGLPHSTTPAAVTTSDFVVVLHVMCRNTYTLIECSNRSPEHSDIYQSLAVAEQYVLYHDLEH